ncbi:DUF4394 domain-containing protein [Streptomyces sp. SCSIO 30461]|uniref:DUF4394 domain-containing protein n=1 Tax=Streptomyces sp. SCSIO 30461 TaxID=3118085 RepID=UPI0030CB500D
MRTRTSLVLSVVLAASCVAPAALAHPVVPSVFGDSGWRGTTAVGLTTDQRLVQFDVDRPSRARSLGSVTGLSGDTELVGIDYRVQDCRLYGVGDQGGIYTLNTRTAVAAKVSQLTVALSGTSFGVDFNPAANRLRIISDTGQNLRHNIDDPAAPLTTIVDGTLTNPTMPPSTALGATAAAYTNNDLNGATATTLFDIDTLADRVSLQSPANAGTLAPTGNLGVDAGPDAGFDIHFDAKSGTNRGFATLETNGVFRLYGVDLLTGKATSKGAFPTNHQVEELALPINKR